MERPPRRRAGRTTPRSLLDEIARLLEDLAAALPSIPLSMTPPVDAGRPLRPGVPLDLVPSFPFPVSPLPLSPGSRAGRARRRGRPLGAARPLGLVDDPADAVADTVDVLTGAAILDPADLGDGAGAVLAAIRAATGAPAADPRVTLGVRVRDAAGEALEPETTLRPVGAPEPLGIALLLAPRPVELTARTLAEPGAELRRIELTLRLSALAPDGGRVEGGEVGLAEIPVPVRNLPVPTVLLLFRHRDFRDAITVRNRATGRVRTVPGALAVVLPHGSPVDPAAVAGADVIGLLDGSALPGLPDLARVAEALGPLLPLPGLAGVTRAILDHGPRVGVRALAPGATGIDDLDVRDFVVRPPVPAALSDIELNREVRSLMLLGAPGAGATFFVRKRRDPARGAFTVRATGDGLLVRVPDLDDPAGSAMPRGGVTLIEEPDSGTFDERLQSLEIL